MLKYSYSVLVYHGEDIARSFERLARFGYDGIELIGEPAQYDAARVRRLSAETGVAVSSICSLFAGEQRDLVHPDPANRRRAVQYVREVADLAAAVGAPVMIVAPSPVFKTARLADPEAEWAWAVEGIRAGADHAASVGVKLCIECWNRYETYFLNSIGQGLALMRAVAHPAVGVMCDTFHMNIEDPSMVAAIHAAGPDLLHVHFADNNRAAPGTGHTDFRPVVKALREIDYRGYVAFELLPPSADPFGVLKAGGGGQFLDPYTKQAIETIRGLEAGLSPAS